MIFYDPFHFTMKFPNQPPFRHLQKSNTYYKVILDSCHLKENQYEDLHIIWPTFFVHNIDNFWITKSRLIQEIKSVVQKTKKLNFYFNAYDSGISPTQLFRQLLNVKVGLGLEANDTTIITGNTYEKFAIEQLLLGEGIYGIKFEIGDREIVNAISDYVAYLKECKKRFIFLCRRQTPWRNIIFFDLHRRGIMSSNNTIYTWSKINPYNQAEEHNNNIGRLMLEVLDRCPDREYASTLTKYVSENLATICNNSPYIIPGELKEKRKLMSGRGYADVVMNSYPAVFQNTMNSLANALNSSALSLTIETQYADDNHETLHLTEKTIRTMFFKLPFLHYANATFLAKLRAMGFETFGDFWDESYDHELNPYERMRKINRQVEEFNEMHWVEFHSLIAKTSDVTNYNYNKLITMTHMYADDFQEKRIHGKLQWNDANQLLN